MEILALELRKLGLKEKEVQVYLAGLALGPNSVQKIAREAKITRPTAYQIIKTLEEKGLFVEVKQRKKRYFTAQSPERILGILKIQKRELEEREREFIRIIAALESKYAPEEGGVRRYRGKEGLKTLEESFSFTPSSNIYVFCSKVNPQEIKQREIVYQNIKKRLGKIEVKEIYSKKVKTKSKIAQVQRKSLPSLDLKGTLILSDKAIFLSRQKPEGFLIDNKLMVDLLKSFFLALWNLI